MKQRGRKSTAANDVSDKVVELSTVVRPKPPSDLSKSEKSLFNKIVGDRDADFFDVATIPLLVEYCRIPTELDLIAGAISRYKGDWLNTDDGLKRFKELTGMRDKAQKRIAILATKMRLAQQSRYEPKVKGVRPKSEGGGPKPWEG